MTAKQLRCWLERKDPVMFNTWDKKKEIKLHGINSSYQIPFNKKDMKNLSHMPKRYLTNEPNKITGKQFIETHKIIPNSYTHVGYFN